MADMIAAQIATAFGLIGWAIGVENIPGIWTWIGGPLMVAGTVMVTIAVTKNNNILEEE